MEKIDTETVFNLVQFCALVETIMKLPQGMLTEGKELNQVFITVLAAELVSPSGYVRVKKSALFNNSEEVTW